MKRNMISTLLMLVEVNRFEYIMKIELINRIHKRHGGLED